MKTITNKIKLIGLCIASFFVMCSLSSCASYGKCIKIDEQTYQQIKTYNEKNGKIALEYLEKDSTISERQKETFRIRERLMQEKIDEMGKQMNGK